MTGRRPVCDLYAVEQSPRGVLRLLHVRLVERIEREERAGDGRRDFPADELGAERRRLGKIDACNRWRRSGKRRTRGIDLAILQRVVDQCEDARTNDRCRTRLGVAERFADDRDDADALLAGALAQPAVRPTTRTARAPAEVSSVSLSRPARAAAPIAKPSATPRWRRGLDVRWRLRMPACRDAPADQRLDVLSHQRRGHQAKERERRIAAANVGGIDEDVAELFAPARVGEVRSLVGDGDEVIGPSGDTCALEQ